MGADGHVLTARGALDAASYEGWTQAYTHMREVCWTSDEVAAPLLIELAAKARADKASGFMQLRVGSFEILIHPSRFEPIHRAPERRQRLAKHRLGLFAIGPVEHHLGGDQQLTSAVESFLCDLLHMVSRHARSSTL
jgi:hypothetical protein